MNLKSDSHLWKICFYLLDWKVFQNDKKCFLLMLTDLFVLEVFKFVSWLFGYAEKRLHKKQKVNFKIYDATDWTKVITIHVLSNFSRSKWKRTMKLCQLRTYHEKYILKNHTQNIVEKLVPDPFLKNQNWAYLISLKCYKVFNVFPCWGLLKYI